MPVVDVQEHVDRFGRTTGWAVVEWDGYVESSRFVPAHKGEPDTPLDLDAQDAWVAWTGERESAKRWAADVWKAARRNNWPLQNDDDVTVRLTLPVGTPVYKGGSIVSLLAHPTDVDYPLRVVHLNDYGEVFIFRQMSEQFPVLPDGVVATMRLLANNPTVTAGTLARKRRTAIRRLVPGDGLWDMVFAWPEAEWETRWAIFTDALRDDYFAWGDAWVRTGDHLAAIDWKPPPTNRPAATPTNVPAFNREDYGHFRLIRE